MEYNVDLLYDSDIFNNNSLTLILDHIKPTSSVLEFGPAYGRMTRYLKEQLKCSVSCVEINPKAESVLRPYAENVIIDNIENFSWKEELKGKKFDYIIFADVLEHLRDPQRVIQEASLLLEENGFMFISVPNIAHNAVIESLYLNKFQYQDSGILDRTHIHFFTKESLEEMIEKTGLYVCSRQATYYSVKMTGILGDLERIPNNLKKILGKRPYAQIYQLVFGVSKSKVRLDTYFDIENFENEHQSNLTLAFTDNVLKNRLKIYFDKGNGFTEKEIVEKSYHIDTSNLFEIELPEAVFVTRMRIDPLDSNCLCVLHEVQIQEENEKWISLTNDSLTNSSTYSAEWQFIFLDDDPQFVFSDINRNIQGVRLRLSILATNFKDDYLMKAINNVLCDMKGKLDSSQSLLQKKQQENARKDILIAQIQAQQKEVLAESEERGNKVEGLTALITLKENEAKEKDNAIATLKAKCADILQESEQRAYAIASLKSQQEMANIEMGSLKDQLERTGVELTHIKKLFEEAQREAEHLKHELMSEKQINDELNRRIEKDQEKIFSQNRCLLIFEDECLKKRSKESDWYEK